MNKFERIVSREQLKIGSILVPRIYTSEPQENRYTVDEIRTEYYLIKKCSTHEHLMFGFKTIQGLFYVQRVLQDVSIYEEVKS